MNVAAPPKMMFAEETAMSMAEGADLMASMVRVSVFQNNELPPQEIFTWYVMNCVYRYIAEEYAVMYKHEGASEEVFKATAEELNGIRLVLANTKQFVLQARIDETLRIREMHMPT